MIEWQGSGVPINSFYEQSNQEPRVPIYEESEKDLYVPIAKANELTYRILHQNVSDPNSRIDENHILKLHRALMSYKRPYNLLFRSGDPIDVIGYQAVENGEFVQKNITFPPMTPKEIIDSFELACRWLDEETQDLKERPDDIIGALKLASEVQYIFTYPGGHFFQDGNGRLSRWLSNEVAILNAYELQFGHFIMPFPWIRHNSNIYGLQPDEWHDDPYLVFLRESYDTGILNPLDVYLGKMWSKNQKRVNDYFERRLTEVYIGSLINECDQELLDVYKKRVVDLDVFIAQQVMDRDESHLAPDFLE